jgi:hypothetical protein
VRDRTHALVIGLNRHFLFGPPGPLSSTLCGGEGRGDEASE